MTKERALDIFQALNHLSKKDRDYFNSLSEDEQKEFLPLIVMRWLTGSPNSTQLLFLNELVNPFVFSLHKHKKLLADLLVVGCSGKSTRYNWIKGPSKRSSSTPLVIDLIQKYYGYNATHAADALKLLNQEMIISHAEELGFQPNEVSALKKELKKLYE